MTNLKNLKKMFIIMLISFTILSCATKQMVAPPSSSAPRKAMDKSLQWVTTSVEYAALCKQVYQNAWPVVKKAALAETRNWVVVLDVDETALDNSQYALERTAVDSGFTRSSWTKWVWREEATPIPGAKAFIDSVRSLGERANVAFITNRSFENEQPTADNLKKYGMMKESDTILTRKNREDTKVDRRRCLETGTDRCAKNGPLVVLALFGDNIRDFMPMQGMDNAKNYRHKKLAQDNRWGQKFFMLPNPTYGSWERDYQ